MERVNIYESGNTVYRLGTPQRSILVNPAGRGEDLPSAAQLLGFGAPMHQACVGTLSATSEGSLGELLPPGVGNSSDSERSSLLLHAGSDRICSDLVLPRTLTGRDTGNAEGKWMASAPLRGPALVKHNPRVGIKEGDEVL